MGDGDYRLYLCSSCCRRCLWNDLSPQEHRCIRCRLPHQGCVICDRKFEPRQMTELYCKRCDFHMIKQASATPPPALDLELDVDIVTDAELFGPTRERSVAQRWQDIKTATGIEDGYFMD